MNISEGFIKRPIATSLLMAAIALFGVVAYRALPVSDLPNVDFPTLLVTAQLPGASPETMGALGGNAARESVLHHRRPRLDDLGQLARRHADHPGIRSHPQARRRRGGRAGGHHAGGPAAAAGHADAADLHEGESGRPADSLSRADVRHAAARGRWTSTPKRASPSASRMVTGVAQVQVLGAQKYAVHVQMDPARAGRRGRSASTKSRPRSRTGTSTSHRHIVGPQRAFTLQATGQLMNADAVPPHGRRLSQRLARAAGGTGQRHRQRRGRQDRLLVLHQRRRTARHRPRHPAPARHQHHRGDRCRQEPAAAVPAPNCRRRSRWTSCYDRSDTIRESYTTCSSPCC